jgi:hypothetical protein
MPSCQLLPSQSDVEKQKNRDTSPVQAKQIRALPEFAMMAFVVFIAGLVGCSHKTVTDERYRPPESILEVVAVLQRHVSDDTYRFFPARDFSGRNIYRASLLRLENIEVAHAEALRAGHFDEVLYFSKGRSFERLGAFALAADSYRTAAQRQRELGDEAVRSAKICEKFQNIVEQTLFEPSASHLDNANNAPPLPSSEFILAAHKLKLADLHELRADVDGTHYEAMLEEEIERVDEERLRYFVSTRHLFIDGDLRAVAEFQRLISRHRESKYANRHILDLANLYADMAKEYAVEHPPAGLYFDPISFEELVDGATQIYENIARLDGTPEKLEAARRLEAFLAFTLRVDVDRFTN